MNNKENQEGKNGRKQLKSLKFADKMEERLAPLQLSSPNPCSGGNPPGK